MKKSKRNRLAGQGQNKRPKSNKSTGRDYSYDSKYEASEKQKKNRALRNAARRNAIKGGKATLGDRTDVHHVKALKKGGKNQAKNLKVISRSSNRAKK